MKIPSTGNFSNAMRKTPYPRIEGQRAKRRVTLRRSSGGENTSGEK